VPGEFPACIPDILGYNDNIIGTVGIESTPVIDRSTNTIYLVARTETSSTGACQGSNPTFIQRLHALDMTTFEERPGSPVVLGGSVACNPSAGGSACNGGTLTFDSRIEDQRSSLALSNGRIFVAWSGHSDQFAYHGWVMVYDAATLQQTMIWSSAPDGTSFNGGGIWMAGRAPVIDASNNVYYTTGNGTWDGVTNFGESFVKLGATPDAPLLDWFTPDDVQFLNDTDLDLGGSGPILVPGTDLIVSGGKSGVFYVTHTGNMGHRTTNDVGIVQVFDNSNPAGSNDQIKGGPVYWNRDGGAGPWMYVWSDGCNHFNAYRFNGTTFDTTPVSQSTILSQCGSSGGVLTLSANGSTPGSGIVWSSMVKSGDGNSNVHAGILRAFDADNLSTELWNSEQNHGRDDMGNWPKFSAPTVAKGRVYLGSFPTNGISDTQVNVYGLFDPPDYTVAVTPSNPGIAPGDTAVLTIDTTAINGYASAVHLDVQGLPPNASASFSTNDFVPPGEATLTIVTDAATPLGEYPLTITATSGALDHEADAGVYVTETTAGEGVIGVDFVGGGAALAATGVAGVLAKPNWNEAGGASGASTPLVDETGALTGATVEWTASGTSSLSLDEQDPNFVMMNGYLDAVPQTTTTVTVSNLPPSSGGYIVYVYGQGTDIFGLNTYTVTPDDGGNPVARTIGDLGTFDGTFIYGEDNQGANYTTMVIGGTGFTLTANSVMPTHTPLNGIQIMRADRIFASDFDE
ncbi:MAG TPA: DUF1735 domain-containing protein, partial [Rhodanobacteraceae bacterium]|nr:DUF1735 domain-containing protein [Rhodanobacteraceae bacterium]